MTRIRKSPWCYAGADAGFGFGDLDELGSGIDSGLRIYFFVPIHFMSLGFALAIALSSYMAFPFEDLFVYKRAVDFSGDIEVILDRERGRMSRSISDQLSRAALSISLNIAEGSGRWHKGEKRQFFWIARGSSFECVPILELMLRKGLIVDHERQALRQQLEIIGKMLTKLVRAHESQSPDRQGLIK